MRYFTPEEANEALVVVRPLVERLVAAQQELARAEAGVAWVRGKVLGDGGALDPRQVVGLEAAVEKASERVADAVSELSELGVQVKDPAAGLVDFPARHPDGSTVLLCWRLGEEEVGYWHTLEGGFAGRNALPF